MSKTLYTIITSALGILAIVLIDSVIIPAMKASQKKEYVIIADHIEPRSITNSLVKEVSKQLRDYQASENKMKKRDVKITVVDLSTLNLPTLNASVSPAQAPIEDKSVKQWGQMVNSADGIIFLVPNYNQGYPAIFKNSVDLIWEPWHTKPVAVIGYSLYGEDGNNLINSFGDVLTIVKTEQVKPALYLPNVTHHSLFNAQQEKELRELFDKLVNSSHKGNFITRIKNAVSSTFMRMLLKFTN
ncbi:NAD(P)H-dependent oxidoreductase [Candidatus Dependentiae bacterium]|nr:NAD(P)H-dependent oxidoreductase [Candidatus Dependentiae bacterium]